MSSQNVVILGGGFAGLWSALGAARKLEELGTPNAATVTLINRDAYHNIRVRNYEADLSQVRVNLPDVVEPAGVALVEGRVVDIDWSHQSVALETAAGPRQVRYDRLVFALGSQLVRPKIRGLAEYGFDVDTYAGAAKLDSHLRKLSAGPPSPEKWTVAVVGAGLTGIEVASEMPQRLRALSDSDHGNKNPRVILVDRNPKVGSDMGESARPVIEAALSALGIERRVGVEIAAVSDHGITLRTGERIAAATVVWCAGMQANPLTRLVPVERDRLGRVPVDPYLRVKGMANVFAAGDCAWMAMDGTHASVMSCQHGRPMGRFAGHNVVCDLFGLPMLALEIDWYVTVLDLGGWGAVYTEGWDRHVVSQGEPAKRTKRLINRERIYPPLNRDRQALLAAAAPVVQSPPASYRR